MKKVRMRGFSEQMRVDEALRKALTEMKIKRLRHEETSIAESLGRVLARDIASEVDVPPFNRSAVDGYAVRSEDTFGASPTNPMVLDVAGIARIGEFPDVAVERMQAVGIATGAPLPEGADAVVMLEYTERIGEQRIEVYRPATPGDNVSEKGEDVRRGDTVLRKNTVLQPQDLGILVALGLDRVRVVRKPRVAVLSTGNELVDPGSEAELGKVVDVNRVIMSAAIKDVGGEPVDLGIAKDDASEIKAKMSEGLRTSDLILVSGGTSVGARDLVPEMVDSLGNPGMIVHGISMRPGKPTGLALVEGKPIVLLPGYPVAAIIAFNTFVRPIIAEMLGISLGPVRGGSVRARMLRRIPSRPGVRDYVRVLVKRTGTGYVAEPIRTTGAGVISSIVKANGLIVVPEELEGIEKDEEVDVILLRSLEE